MITIKDKSLCCGCTACVTSCPVQCIVMRRDREGFDYPVANPDICIGCRKCEKVCPVLNPAEEHVPLAVYASLSLEYRDEGSSGGVFPALADKFIASGGTVYGAVLDRDMTVGHADASTYYSVRKFRGSKYVQSDLYSVFEEVRDQLSDGRKVLFSGTPCQVAGLNAYLGRSYDGLLTLDLACHGVPSPGLWEKYVKALEMKYGGKLTDVNFRDKSRSWRQFGFKVEVEGHGPVSVPFIKDPFMALFIQNMSLRPSCYNCPAKQGRSGSDLTLADFWGVSEVLPEMDDDKGVSLVHVNSEKGRQWLESLELQSVKTVPEVSGIRNDGFKSIIPVPERREEFFKGVHSASDLIRYMSSFVVVKPWYKVVSSRIRKFLAGVKRRLTI